MIPAVLSAGESSARLKGLRKTGRERFEQLPWPAKTDEEWRRTDPASIPSPAVELQPAEPSFNVGWEAPAPEAIRAGVILTDLRTALRQFPELVEEHLFRTAAPKGLAKFVALHQAQWSQGLFCYVPEGVKLELPLRAWAEPAGGKSAIFPHTLVVVGKEAELTLIDERRGGGESALLSDEMAELSLGEGAVLRYVRLQHWKESVTEIFSQQAFLKQHAHLLNINVGLGGALTKANIETVLDGPETRAELLGIFFGSGDQHFDIHTLQDHRAPRAFSDLLYKSALKDRAKAIYTGLIRIEKQAQHSDAYQANRNLLLSQGAKADSIPMLEIEANDVRCTHGVAVGPVDPDQAFYLMSRGLSAAEAQRLIVEGFFEQVFCRIPVGSLREQLRDEVAARLEDSHG